jgi:hypothetical protein
MDWYDLKYKMTHPSMPQVNMRGMLWVLGMIVVMGVVGLISAVLAGVVLALSGNATIANFQINFDPQITIAYLLVNFFVSRYYLLTQKQSYNFFVLSLLMSFVVTFIQGALFLILLPPVLKGLRLISSNTPKL